MKYLDCIQKGIDFIEARLHTPIPLKEVSAHVNMSHWHFQRIFKAVTNETLKSYVRSRRIANSMQLLFNKQLSILDVALESGFDSHEAYTRAFQRLFGTTPSEYRNKAQQSLILKKPKLDSHYLENLNNNLVLEPRIHNFGGKQLVGIKISVIGIESEKTNIASKLPELWNNFMQCMHVIPNRVKDYFYGVISTENDEQGNQQLFYCACAEVTHIESNDVPTNMTTFHLSEQVYAEFTHKGLVNVEHFNHTISYIYSNWLLRSNMKHTYGPDVEVYGPEFKMDSHDSVVYYAIPVTNY